MNEWWLWERDQFFFLLFRFGCVGELYILYIVYRCEIDDLFVYELSIMSISDIMIINRIEPATFNHHMESTSSRKAFSEAFSWFNKYLSNYKWINAAPKIHSNFIYFIAHNISERQKLRKECWFNWQFLILLLIHIKCLVIHCIN